ncbi:NDP-sugar epimerase, includes UDP-GlcNAc-inverting 4,6-dehydratase FlaA1 and capsular polysaccharide biosynthesis protein EpsC [Phyllobacterium sp. YR620]|uniref:polysaccharide biosynthesis protein n=1 Tax=unclassified Phyllobacterium TaxID=2638441 RepID=UPI000487EA74|nr:MULTISPECIES: nucleoside-diphosphate sugar epimerase/dehydratase [unclassified Phyllobacterium]SDP70957.1 NDP-sugar epimerase, includes UDP-GlcNAc-inverting 4,6-dehydratase FlaA1 and capsular polysaccharide biosynthesis protein EpsC [Phyllobacterium sp. YR620]
MTLENFRQGVSMMPRRYKQLILVVFDVIALTFAVWLSYLLRFGTFFIPNSEQALLMVAAPLIGLPVFIRFGLYRAVIRYLPDKAIWTMIQAVTISVILWVCLAFLTLMTGAEGVPRAIPFLYWVLSIGIICGSRFGAKWLLWSALRDKLMARQCLIFGAGDAGRQLANALRSQNEVSVAGFIDDDRSLHGMDILGIRVYPTQHLETLIDNFGISELIVTTSSLSGIERRRLIGRLKALDVKVRILPAISDLTAGKYLVSHLRDIDIDDLLGRSPVPADPTLLDKTVEGRVILVTGAGGSIGSELCRTIVKLAPAKLIVFDVNEHSIYQLQRELAGMTDCVIVPALGSISDASLIRALLAEHKVENVYHCAAYKHVPLVEENVVEGARNNVIGTDVLAAMSQQAGVRNFVLISSDKAVRPSNVMGATKRWAELIVRHQGDIAREQGTGQIFASVRFGNVIGSSGSVVPLFREQIAQGGPLTVTHDDMTRYFMSVREAAELIIQAGALSEGGDILLLEMGEPVRIRDLAENMILLAGLSVKDSSNPDGDIEIVTVGIRDGEKLHEELFYDPTGVGSTSHTKILRAQRRSNAADRLPDAVAELQLLIERRDTEGVRKLLYERATS